jgi:hypothetical protein
LRVTKELDNGIGDTLVAAVMSVHVRTHECYGAPTDLLVIKCDSLDFAPLVPRSGSAAQE